MAITTANLTKTFRIFKRDAGLKGALKSFFHRKYENFTALSDVSLEIGDGEIVGILGENGAGKTTLIKLMVGLLHPTDGNVLINGFTPWERKNQFLRRISVVMGQKNQLWWDIPASESFLLNQKIYGLEDDQYKQTLGELVDLLGVQEKLNVQVRRLSLGERMKMEIIAALLHRPEIILLDEPTIGLDVIAQSKIRDFVKYYNEQHRSTFLITSHYMNDIQEMCKRVVVIHKGKKFYDGNFDILVNRVNPVRKLTFEFVDLPDGEILQALQKEFVYKLDSNFLTAELRGDDMNQFMSRLFTMNTPRSFSLEELPVEETMKSFFANPEKFIKGLG
ncbi:MAG: ATP-binding cassette domain-containing protein [Candidatus Marinimicrobia bacterium]|nr:ATP-binding cassette domain-containing protein [Candidatus Neomarinimicrobiota bacterium]